MAQELEVVALIDFTSGFVFSSPFVFSGWFPPEISGKHVRVKTPFGFALVSCSLVRGKVVVAPIFAKMSVRSSTVVAENGINVVYDPYMGFTNARRWREVASSFSINGEDPRLEREHAAAREAEMINSALRTAQRTHAPKKKRRRGGVLRSDDVATIARDLGIDALELPLLPAESFPNDPVIWGSSVTQIAVRASPSSPPFLYVRTLR